MIEVLFARYIRKGKGFPCFVSVEQDGTGSGLGTALALSRAIGATKAGAMPLLLRKRLP